MDDMVMDDGNNSEMTMTFTSWSVYKLQILFDSWNVDTKWEFALRLIYLHVFMSSCLHLSYFSTSFYLSISISSRLNVYLILILIYL